MKAEQEQLIAVVRERLGSKAVVTDPSDIAPWLTDWRGKFHGQSPAMLAPARRGHEPVSSTTAPASAATKTLCIAGAAVKTWNVPTTSRAVNPG